MRELSFFFLKDKDVSSRCLGDDGEMERALPEARFLRLHGDHLCLDQVRGEVEHRAHQRQEHPGHLLRLVT